ncbi:TPA: hypothetical protein HA244_00725 [Candidatus Micrarchaeota archaeon]|nr:hypothetical protein [Candidatus Micrarchaeota archaeon]
MAGKQAVHSVPVMTETHFHVLAPNSFDEKRPLVVQITNTEALQKIVGARARGLAMAPKGSEPGPVYPFVKKLPVSGALLDVFKSLSKELTRRQVARDIFREYVRRALGQVLMEIAEKRDSKLAKESNSNPTVLGFHHSTTVKDGVHLYHYQLPAR